MKRVCQIPRPASSAEQPTSIDPLHVAPVSLRQRRSDVGWDRKTKTGCRLAEGADQLSLERKVHVQRIVIEETPRPETPVRGEVGEMKAVVRAETKMADEKGR